MPDDTFTYPVPHRVYERLAYLRHRALIWKRTAKKHWRLANRRLELLRRLEWPDYDDKFDDYFCYICDANKTDGHANDCELAKELKNDNENND